MTLIEVLAAHQWHHSFHGCVCDLHRRIGNDAAMASHQAKMIAAAGLAVIELPAAEGLESALAEFDLTLIDDVDVPVQHRTAGWQIHRRSAHQARRFAAALLAVANAADQVQS